MRNRLSFLLILVLLAVSVLAVSPSKAQTYPAWDPNSHAYSVGDQVTYQDSSHPNHLYKCQQAHTSQAGWNPPAVPALWIDEGAYSGGGSTNTPVPATNTSVPATKTNTPTGATATKTNTPKPATNTSVPATNTNVPPTATSSGSGSNPAWDCNKAYNAGDKVSYNGENYHALLAVPAGECGWIPGSTPTVWQDDGPAGSGGGSTNTPVPATNTATFVPATNTPGGPTATKTNTAQPTATSGGSSSGIRIMGYYADWDVYGRNFQPKGIVTDGTAAKLTHLIFAFGNVTNGACAIGDSYADYQKNYDAASSVSGVADPTDGSIATGIIHQLKEIKAQYPNLKIIYSFGGWTWSSGFGAAAANAAAFADSCYNIVHDSRWNGVFDGIDIDWEYPNACGNSCDTSGFGAYKTLMSALRSRFGSDLVTAAITADGSANGKMDAADYGGAAQYVDWYNVMSYDFFGAWAATGPTAPHSPLYSYSGIPTAGFDTDDAVQKLKGKGVPSSKIQIGIGFYGRGWTGVTQAAPGGSASQAATGTYEAGIEDYHVLVNSCPSNGTIAGTAYAFCAPNWWSYDTPSTIAGKMSYAKNQGLGGAFFWEAFGDTSNGDLITAMYNNR